MIGRDNGRKLEEGKDKERGKADEGSDGSSTMGSSSKSSLLRESLKKDNFDDDVLRELEIDPLYHGLIPQEDLCFILSEVGDFVMRSVRSRATKRAEVVISVETSKHPLQIKHIRIHREQNKDGKLEWYATERYKYGSMKELVRDYIKSKRPIHPDVMQSVLVHGIGLQTWEFRHSDIKLSKLLGEGQFASVHQGEIVAGPLKKRVAIKKPRFTKEQEEKEVAMEIYRGLMHEARLMRVFDHPNVAKCNGIAVTKLPLLIVLELIDGGALEGYLRKNQGKIPRYEKMINMCYATAKGLQYLHENKCIHRDIASRNILYTSEKIAKISDFGLSRIGDVYTMKKGKRIPIKWTAPETVAALVYTQKSDVFSYSIFMWEVFTDGDEPYEGLTHMEVRQRVGCGARLDRPLHCPKYMFYLMRKCWEQNPDERYNMKQVVRFFEEYLRRRGRRQGQDTEMDQTLATMATMKDGDDEADETSGKKDEDDDLVMADLANNGMKPDAARAIQELEKRIEKLQAISSKEQLSDDRRFSGESMSREQMEESAYGTPTITSESRG